MELWEHLAAGYVLYPAAMLFGMFLFCFCDGYPSARKAYAKISYPSGSTYKTAYVPLYDTLVAGKKTDSAKTAAVTKTGCFSDRCAGTNVSTYKVTKGSTLYLLAQDSSYSQILFQEGSNWRIAWCTNAIYRALTNS